MKSVLYIAQLVILTADLTFTKTVPTSQHKTKRICKASCQVLCTPECDFKCCLPQPQCASYCPQSCYPDCKPDCCRKSPEALRDNLKCPGRCRFHCYPECDASCCISTRTSIVEQSSITRLAPRNDLDGSNWDSTGTQRSSVMKYCPPLCPRRCLPLCSSSCCAILPPAPPLQGICPQQCMYFCHPYCEPKCCVSSQPSLLQTSHSLPIPRGSFPQARSVAPPLYPQASCPPPCRSKCFSQCTRECCNSLTQAPDVIVLIPRPPDVCPAPCPSSCYPKCDKDCCCSKASQAADGICALI